MKNIKTLQKRNLSSKKAKFNVWVGQQYKKIFEENSCFSLFEKKIIPRIDVIISYFIKDVSFDGKTENQKKEMLFQHFLTILEKDKNIIKHKLLEDKKYQTEDTINERKRILNNYSKRNYVNNFYLSNRWLSLKKQVRNLYKCGCMKCGKYKCEIHIDHIFPRSLYSELEYSIHNLQILCRDCNMEKSNMNNTDYRTEKQIKLCTLKYPK